MAITSPKRPFHQKELAHTLLDLRKHAIVAHKPTINAANQPYF